MLKSNIILESAELIVQDKELIKDFYQRIIGLTDSSRTEKVLILTESRTAKFALPNQAGMYHLAFVYPTRAKLAKIVAKFLQEFPNLYQGSADHIVTEAFYFTDPEGNGLELYFDKPETEWEYDQNGKPPIGMENLDVRKYIDSYAGLKVDSQQPKIGHIHLKVGDIDQAKKFYVDLLMFDIIIGMPTALFVSRDNYHHHLGMNIWESQGAGVRPKGYAGLKGFQINYLDEMLYQEIINNLKSNKVKFEQIKNNQIRVIDPWGIEIILKHKQKI